jgi:hypothetical protein
MLLAIVSIAGKQKYYVVPRQRLTHPSLDDNFMGNKVVAVNVRKKRGKLRFYLSCKASGFTTDSHLAPSDSFVTLT